MTPRATPYAFLVASIVAALNGAACGGNHNPAGNDPVPAPSAAPREEVLMTRPFNARPNTYGFSAIGPPIFPGNEKRPMEYVLALDADSPPGQVHLFLIRDQGVRIPCYDAYDNFACPEIVRRAMEPEVPKRIILDPPERLYIWVPGIVGETKGTVKIGYNLKFP
jgi:hypothetical protein